MNTETEIRRRFDLVINNAPRDSIEFGFSGSMVMFNMGLNLLGGNDLSTYNWIDEDYTKPCMSVEDFQSSKYDTLLESLFTKLYSVSEHRNTWS